MIAKRIIVTAILAMLAVGLIFYIMPIKTTLICFGIALFAASYFWVLAARKPRAEKDEVKPGYLRPSLLSVLFLITPLSLSVVLLSYGVFGKTTIFNVALLTGLAINFFNYFFSIPLALRHKYLETKSRTPHVYSYPRVTIIVPAYNEENCLGQTIEALLEVDYPYKEIIVVDDGSTDKTYDIATRYKGEGVTVLRRPNGGKTAALNYGLLFAQGEIVVTVDADSLVSRGALKEIVRRFEDQRVSAVAGNVKVLNRHSLLTKCQALEYIVDINMFRRAFDIFGAVPCIPGCLGAFRKEVLAGVGFYDPSTLTEDFDSTVKVLKAKGSVRACDARVYTQAPETLKDFYRQRLRWYRGNLQTIIRHKDAFANPRFGWLHKLVFPFQLFQFIFIPLLSIIVLASVTIMILNGNGMQVLHIFAFFTLLQFLLTMLAIQLDGENIKLVIYSPFFVFGYKQLIDLVLLKSMFDVFTKRKVGWTSAKRMAFQTSELPKRSGNRTIL